MARPDLFAILSGRDNEDKTTPAAIGKGIVSAKTLAQESRDNRFGGVVNNEALGRYVERIETLHHERKSLNDDIREVYSEAKEAGLVPAILRQIVRERRLDDEVRHDQYALLDTYRRALGMLADTPLGEAALRVPQRTAPPGQSPPLRRSAGSHVAAARPAAQERRPNGRSARPPRRRRRGRGRRPAVRHGVNGLLALDVATTTGWAYGAPGERPAWGHFRAGMRGAAAGEVLALFRAWLEERCTAWRPSWIAFESPYVPRVTPARIRTATGHVIGTLPSAGAPIDINVLRR